jgi:hypothetical protein
MVVVRYQSFAANAVLTHRFESVARPPLRCDGSRAGIKRCPPLRFFSALSLFGALAQACKQSSRRFVDSLHSFVAPAFHEQKQTTGEIGNVRQSVGVENEYR